MERSVQIPQKPHLHAYLPLRKYWMNPDEGTSAHWRLSVGAASPRTPALTLLSSWSLELS